VIAQLAGTLVDKGLDAVVVDVGGVGYHLHISLATLQAMPPVGQPVRLLTYLQVREDALTLYGFATASERRAFELCLSVTGIGPKLALAALSGLGAAALSDAIVAEDVGRLVRVPGIGKKTAERMVMELRDKFKPQSPKAMGSRGAALGSAAKGANSSEGTGPQAAIFSDVASALCNLGYKSADAERAVAQVLESASGDGAAVPAIEEVLRRALRALQKD
jgi:Holliday junction DNA helicase RuvA